MKVKKGEEVAGRGGKGGWAMFFINWAGLTGLFAERKTKLNKGALNPREEIERLSIYNQTSGYRIRRGGV